MTDHKRPMLAAKFDVKRVQAILDEVGFMYMQPKIDGMRAMLAEDAEPRSRSGKILPNRYLRQWVRDHPSLRGLDGEVVAGHVYDPSTFRASMSGVRAEDGSPDFTFYAFDYFLEPHSTQGYAVRHQQVQEMVLRAGELQKNNGYSAKLVVCPTMMVSTMDDVARNEEELITKGWEGGILRHPKAPYKHNRSTPREGALIKLKRFEDAEARVIGYEPWYHNANEATQSPLGFTTRSSHQDNQVPLERLGALQCELLTDPSVKFKIGVMRGISHTDRDRLWEARDTLIGRICTFAHQGYGGGYDAPRTPVFLNWRSEHDL